MAAGRTNGHDSAAAAAAAAYVGPSAAQPWRAADALWSAHLHRIDAFLGVCGGEGRGGARRAAQAGRRCVPARRRPSRQLQGGRSFPRGTASIIQKAAVRRTLGQQLHPVAPAAPVHGVKDGVGAARQAEGTGVEVEDVVEQQQDSRDDEQRQVGGLAAVHGVCLHAGGTGRRRCRRRRWRWRLRLAGRLHADSSMSWVHAERQGHPADHRGPRAAKLCLSRANTHLQRVPRLLVAVRSAAV